MSIGTRFPKSDGASKADGSGIYADDISLPRMLHAKILRSPARARAHPQHRRQRGASSTRA